MLGRASALPAFCFRMTASYYRVRRGDGYTYRRRFFSFQEASEFASWVDSSATILAFDEAGKLIYGYE